MTRERPVTADGTSNPETGWFCYYVYGKGGSGYYDPVYVYDPELKLDGSALAEHFAYGAESEFFNWASAPCLDAFRNVKPPLEAIQKLIAAEKRTIKYAEEEIEKLNGTMIALYPEMG